MKKIMLGTSDDWSLRQSSHRPSVLYWRLSDYRLFTDKIFYNQGDPIGVFQEIAQKAMQTAPRKYWLDRTIENRLMTYEAWFSLARYNLYEMVNPILFIDNHRQSFKMTLRGKTHTDVDFLLPNTNCWCFRFKWLFQSFQS